MLQLQLTPNQVCGMLDKLASQAKANVGEGCHFTLTQGKDSIKFDYDGKTFTAQVLSHGFTHPAFAIEAMIKNFVETA